MTAADVIDRGDAEAPVDDDDVYDGADWSDIVDGDVDEPESVAVRMNWKLRLAALVLAAVLLTLTGLTGFFGWHYVKDRQIAAAAAAALSTANSYAVTLTSVDSNNLDANFAAVLDGSTGEFHDMYAKSSVGLRNLLIEHKATAQGVVVDSSVKSAGPDEVVVLLFVDQTVANTEVRDPRVDHSRMVMTMRNVDGRWKAANVELP